MDFFQAVVLGLIQGLTEFLPISSSGHLVLFQHLFGFKESMLAFDLVLHWATLLAVFVYFKKDLIYLIDHFFRFAAGLLQGKSPADLFRQYPGARVSLLIVVASIPTGVIGVLFKDAMEALFKDFGSLGIQWLIMGAVLVYSSRHDKGTRTLEEMGVGTALLIGLAQGVAIIPAVSRSGLTICAAFWMGIEKKAAARFSFLIGIPAILAAGLMELRHGLGATGVAAFPLAAGFMVSLIAGYLSIAFLLNLIQRDKLHIFGYYSWFMAAVVAAIVVLEKVF